MKLDSVSGRNFKCGTFKNKLTPITIFVGENGKGKTSRINCINIALSGKDPALKKKSSKIDAGQTAADIMAFGCGNPMSAAVGTDTGLNLERVYAESKGKATCTPSPDCDGIEIPGVLTDPSAYLNMTLNEQRDYVFGLVPMPDAKDTFTELVASLKNHKFEENTVQTEEAIKACVAFINQNLDPAKTAQDQLEFFVVELKKRKSEADAAIKRMTGTVQGVTELASEALSDPTPEINAAKQTLERLLGEQRDLQNALQRAQEVQQQREKIQQQILELRSPYYDVTKLKAELDALRQSVNTYQTMTHALEAELAALAAKRDAARDAGAKLGQDALKAQQQVQERTRLEQELAQAQQEALGLAELEAELRQKQERVAELGRSSRLVEKDVHTLKLAINVVADAPLPDDNLALALSDMIRNNANQVVDTSALNDQVIRRQVARNRCELLTQKLALLPPAPDLSAMTAALEAKRTEYKELAAQLPPLEQKLKESRAADQKHAADQVTLAQKEAELQRLNEAPKRIKELEMHLVGMVPVPEGVTEAAIEFLKPEIEKLRTNLTILDTRYRQYIAQKGEAATKQKALNQRLLLEAESAVAKVAVELVQKRQSSMVAEAFKDILLVANQVTSGVLPAALEYRDGEIGMMRPQGKASCQWVTTRTMSGSEQLCAFAAISTSLAVKSPIRLLLLDEVGRIDADHSVALMRNLCGMIEDGSLDQVVLCGLSAPQMPEEVAGSPLVSVIEL